MLSVIVLYIICDSYILHLFAVSSIYIICYLVSLHFSDTILILGNHGLVSLCSMVSLYKLFCLSCYTAACGFVLCYVCMFGRLVGGLLIIIIN